MRRVQIEEDTIRDLENKIKVVKRKKEQLIRHLEKLKQDYAEKKISYSEYGLKVYKKINGRAIPAKIKNSWLSLKPSRAIKKPAVPIITARQL